MSRKLKKRITFSDNILAWIGVPIVLIAAIILDKSSAPHKWHAAIMWTACAFYGVLIFGRKQRNSYQFWTFWGICLGLHILAMWVIFAKLLPRLILGTLYVVPIAFVEAIFLFGIILKMERILMRLRGRQLHLKAK